MERGSGILLHITSLPAKYGIGTFGESAFQFVEFLAKAKQKYWQILPLGPTGYGDSPYQSFSSHAINPYFIDLEFLARDGLLEFNEFSGADFGQYEEKIDYNALFLRKYHLLQAAYIRGKDRFCEEIKAFSRESSAWLSDYSLYMALKAHFDQKEWNEWDEDIRRRDHEAMNRYREILADEIEFWEFIQFIGYRQWKNLKEFSNSCGIKIIGDIPIYVAYDSVDTWANGNSGIFKFDQELRPVGIAGCPPDYFTPNGQYWGNPVYDWQKNKETGYAWWIERIRTCMKLYDIVRIDHFRGLESYWEIPRGAQTAAAGQWRPGPGMDFVHALRESLEEVHIIAEDLGLLTQEVFDFKEESGFPGMKVLQFAFDGYNGNVYLPHNYERNCVVYTGTHDNDTTSGWLNNADSYSVNLAKSYFNLTEEEGTHWGMIRGAESSVADVAIIPMQDLLGLGSGARMNTPSTFGGTNWKWSMKPGDISNELAGKLADIVNRYSR